MFPLRSSLCLLGVMVHVFAGVMVHVFVGVMVRVFVGGDGTCVCWG